MPKPASVSLLIPAAFAPESAESCRAEKKFSSMGGFGGRPLAGFSGMVLGLDADTLLDCLRGGRIGIGRVSSIAS